MINYLNDSSQEITLLQYMFSTNSHTKIMLRLNNYKKFIQNYELDICTIYKNTFSLINLQISKVIDFNIWIQ